MARAFGDPFFILNMEMHYYTAKAFLGDKSGLEILVDHLINDEGSSSKLDSGLSIVSLSKMIFPETVSAVVLAVASKENRLTTANNTNSFFIKRLFKLSNFYFCEEAISII